MDIEQEEMQFPGFFEIYREAYKLIFRSRKIFTQITLSLLILLLFFIYVGYHEEVSHIFHWGIGYTKFNLHHTKALKRYYHKLSNPIRMSSMDAKVPFGSTLYVRFRANYFIFVLVFSQLSTLTVVYPVARVYTSREITFKKVISVVPIVLKRLTITSLCVFYTFCSYGIVFALTLSSWGASATIANSKIGMVRLSVVIILYATGLVYMNIIWQLAGVVSVLEESYGFEAMTKSKDLIKGKLVLATATFFQMNLSLAIINLVFEFSVIYLVLSLILILSHLVVQTVVYLVCKSYHHEIIDKSALSDNLEVYLRSLRMLRWKVVISKFVYYYYQSCMLFLWLFRT